MLEVNRLSLTFGDPVLREVSFMTDAGTITGIVGPSGGGKSSLLKIVAGLLDADSGEVRWKGKQVPGPSQKLIPGHPDIQLVNQDFGLDPYHTAAENILQRMLSLPTRLRNDFQEELIDLVELERVRDRQAYLLSGGEQQRLAIARALAAEPELLLLDEPFAHLDVHLKQKIGSYLRKLSEIRGTTCVLVSHEGQDVLQWCETIRFMSDGEVQRTASPQEFYFHPASEYEGLFFGEINTLAGVLFRPDEYALAEKGTGIPVQFREASFAGAFWRNVVCTDNNETLVLFAQQPLKHVSAISIVKKDS